MKIVCISDTHGKHWWLTNNNRLPEGDIIIHSGDCTPRGATKDIEEFLRWYGDLNYEKKILIAGNHDWGFEKEPGYCEELCKSYDIIYLNDSGITHRGLKIWGSPVQPWFYDWAFNRRRGDDIQKHWDLIPDDTDILITHGPSMGHVDQVMLQFSPNAGQHVGCADLEETIQRIRPVIHICGHIHEARGVDVDIQEGKSPITYVNASSLDEMYSPWIEDAMVFEWDDLVNGRVKPYRAYDY